MWLHGFRAASAPPELQITQEEGPAAIPQPEATPEPTAPQEEEPAAPQEEEPADPQENTGGTRMSGWDKFLSAVGTGLSLLTGSHSGPW